MRLFRQLVIMGILAFSVADTCSAITELPLKRFDTTVLRATQGYKTYQWQVSTDGVAFFNLSGATSDTLALKCFSPSYYRIQVTGEDGIKTNLDTFKVKFDEITYYNSGWNLPTSHGYVEVNGKPGSGISIPAGTASSLR